MKPPATGGSRTAAGTKLIKRDSSAQGMKEGGDAGRKGGLGYTHARTPLVHRRGTAISAARKHSAGGKAATPVAAVRQHT